MPEAPLVGSIEAGGTKFVCTVGRGPHDIRDELRYPTTTPDETLGRAVAFFREQEARHGRLEALGIGSFGPIDLNEGSPTWGHVTSTPKPGWSGADFVGRMRVSFDVPIGWDTDVNAAALGEHTWGAAQGIDTFVYITVGTGIGGGGMSRGRLLHGLIHPEIGHIRPRRDPVRDPYEGCCPYHGDCLEGLASGSAIHGRWKTRGTELPPDHEAWDLEADYLAQGVVSLMLILSPRRVIMGGGVMKQQQVFPKLRRRVLELLNGYVQSPAILDAIDEYIVPPALGDQAGMLGGIALAQRALARTL
ncbi:MAG: ROK family protein [Planctomycetota bacterium]|nr:ROK family protein [Planctomycetota bacterium]